MHAPVATSWRRIEAWLKENDPEILSKLNPGASAAEIAAAERELGVKFPDDVREYFRIHNGGSDANLFPESDFNDAAAAYSPLSLKEVVSTWKAWKQMLADGEFDEYGGNEHWKPGWIPVASTGADEDLLIDLEPIGEGRGRLFKGSYTPTDPVDWAESLGAYLEHFADKMESGQYIVLEMWGLVDIDHPHKPPGKRKQRPSKS